MYKWNILAYGICGILCLAMGSGSGMVYPLVGAVSLGMCLMYSIKSIKNKKREDC